MSSHYNFQSGREGPVYATGFVGDLARAGPFKVGETMHTGQCRLDDSDTFLHPDHPMEVVRSWGFLDRIWAEHRIHLLLQQYRVARRANQRKPQEFFRCALDVIEWAVRETRKLEAVYAREWARAQAYVGADPTEFDICSEHSLVKAVLGHRLSGKRVLGDLFFDASLVPSKSQKTSKLLYACGLRFLPVTNIVVFRTAAQELDIFLKKLGYSDGTSQLGALAGFDDDGNSISNKELKKRCAGYVLAELIS